MSELVDLSPGAVFAEEFKVVRPLARGGMGAVYVVEQIGTARERALKLMHPQIASDAKSIERFQREAQVASKIDSDHIVEVIGAGVDDKTQTPWLCMELLKGETLADRVEKSGRMSREHVLEVVKQLGHALSAAHRAGIVHRDLKPENIFLADARREGVPFTLKVLDFGVAALVADAKGAKTTQGVGSPMWMAPEQTDVGRVTTATDVWALGLIAFYLLTGKIYWKSVNLEGSPLTALLVEMMVEEMPSASSRAAELLASGLVPPGFDAWFAHATDRDPGKRIAEAGTATSELVAILDGAPTSAFETTAAAPAAIAASPPRARLAQTEPMPPKGGVPGWIWGVVGIVVLGIVGAGLFAILGGEAPPTTVAVAAPPPTTTIPFAMTDPDAGNVAADDEDEADEDEDDDGEDEAEDDDGDDSDEEAEDDDESEDDEDDDESDEGEDDTAPSPSTTAQPR